MMAAWRQTDFRLTVEERMGKTFSEAALSITITSITDALSIGIGAITHFRSVRIFCTFTVVAVLFDYFYQITFFGACMVLMGRREERNLHPATCMKAVPTSQAGDDVCGDDDDDDDGVDDDIDYVVVDDGYAYYDCE